MTKNAAATRIVAWYGYLSQFTASKRLTGVEVGQDVISHRPIAVDEFPRRPVVDDPGLYCQTETITPHAVLVRAAMPFRTRVISWGPGARVCLMMARGLRP